MDDVANATLERVVLVGFVVVLLLAVVELDLVVLVACLLVAVLVVVTALELLLEVEREEMGLLPDETDLLVDNVVVITALELLLEVEVEEIGLAVEDTDLLVDETDLLADNGVVVTALELLFKVELEDEALVVDFCVADVTSLEVNLLEEVPMLGEDVTTGLAVETTLNIEAPEEVANDKVLATLEVVTVLLVDVNIFELLPETKLEEVPLMADKTGLVADDRAEGGEEGDLRNEVVEAIEPAFVVEEVPPCDETRFKVFEMDEGVPRDEEKEFEVAEVQ